MELSLLGLLSVPFRDNNCYVPQGHISRSHVTYIRHNYSISVVYKLWVLL